MPGFNRQGPAGQGPMTGRGMGPCAQSVTQPEQPTRVEGRGMGYGRKGCGNGRGFGQGQGKAHQRGFGQGQGRGHQRHN